MAETSPCPRRRCDGAMVVVEEGVLNGVAVRYWRCPTCMHVVRLDEPAHDEPRML